MAAHLLEEEIVALHPDEGGLAEALRRVALQLEGRNALAALNAATGELAAVKNGSPLVVGLNEGAAFLASDAAALLAHAQRMVYLHDGEVVDLRPGDARLYDAASGVPLPLRLEDACWRADEADLDGHHHYLDKEIRQQPALLRRIAAEGLPQACGLARFLEAADAVHLVACGTAYHAALAASYIWSSEAGRLAIATHAHEFGAVAPHLAATDGVVAFSQSGETIDVLDAVRAAQHRGARVAALVNVPRSTLTRHVTLSVLLGAGPETSVLATKTFSAKLAYVLLVAGILAGHPERHMATLWEAAADMDDFFASARLAAVRALACRLATHEHLFVLGRGLGYPLALETALKIKEVTYIHAEGFPAGELKHGVIALVEPGTPVLVLAPDGADAPYLLAAAGEVKARGAFVIGIGPRDHEVFDAHLPVCAPGLAYYAAVLPVVQYLAYELALLRGTDPDKPRNLAKSVTVR